MYLVSQHDWPSSYKCKVESSDSVIDNCLSCKRILLISFPRDCLIAFTVVSFDCNKPSITPNPKFDIIINFKCDNRKQILMYRLEDRTEAFQTQNPNQTYLSRLKRLPTIPFHLVHTKHHL